MALQDYDRDRATFTMFYDQAKKYKSKAQAHRIAKKLNEWYGWPKVKVSYI